MAMKKDRPRRVNPGFDAPTGSAGSIMSDMSASPRRNILHVDMDAFYASVEQRDQPALRGKPVLVGGDPGSRGVVAAASYEARKFGCRSAMPTGQARRLCPQAIIVHPRMSVYVEVSRQVFAIFEQFTPLVEPLSIDEAFLDVTGTERLLGDAEHVACQIRQRIRDEVRLTASVGLAPNKFLAKLASDLEKPDGLTVVPADNVQAFLDPLPIERLWGRRTRNAQTARTVGHCDVRRLAADGTARIAATFRPTGRSLSPLGARRGFARRRTGSRGPQHQP